MINSVKTKVVLHNLLRLRHLGNAVKEIDYEDLNKNDIPVVKRDEVD